MPSLGKITLRRALLGGVLIYLAGDLWLWHGPLRRQLDRANPHASPVVARVFDQPITRSQLDRAVNERLWLEGKSSTALAPEQLKLAREAALEGLIDHALLRLKTTAMAPQLTVSAADIQTRLRRFYDRFEAPDTLPGAMKSQGIASEHELRDRLAARIQQEKYLASQIASTTKVTDAEARQWFDDNRSYLTIPERVEARHLFIPTLDHPPEAAKAKLTSALAALTTGKKDFVTLARELSEDPATKDNGGMLGWMTRDRLPADFATPVFSLALHQPALIRSRLGWHLVEVTARKPAAQETFEQAKPEIIAALEAVKSRQAIIELRSAMRQSASPNIIIDHNRLAE